MSGLATIKETTEILNEIKQSDLKTAQKEELLGLIAKFQKHSAVIGTLVPGRVICRDISCNYLKDDPISVYPLTVPQLSYNPNFALCGYNRASWEGESAFYGSIETEKLKGYYTCSLEVLAELQENNKEIDCETFVVGKWIVKKEINLIHISGTLKNNSIAVSERYNTWFKSSSKYPENIIPLKLIDTYLCDEFVKDVPKNEKWKYKVSAAYSDFVKKDNWPGLIYPSLKSDGAGYNVALFPETLYDYIEFERAALITYYKRGKSITNEITMEALPDGDLLRWKEIYTHLLPPKMKRWYTGLSDDNSFENYIDYQDL